MFLQYLWHDQYHRHHRQVGENKHCHSSLAELRRYEHREFHAFPLPLSRPPVVVHRGVHLDVRCRRHD